MSGKYCPKCRYERPDDCVCPENANYRLEKAARELSDLRSSLEDYFLDQLKELRTERDRYLKGLQDAKMHMDVLSTMETASNFHFSSPYKIVCKALGEGD